MNTAYDLKTRNIKFAENIIQFCSSLPRNAVTNPLITQLVKSGTSIGANYHEADDAESRDDFKHKIGIVKKEASETNYWLELISIAVPPCINKASLLQNESRELHLIFNSIYNKCK